MKWATRAHMHIDRAACAWLIRRLVDPGAEFVFVSDPADVPADATAFDMRGVELSHHGGDCSFETILRRYEITDPVLWRIAEIVHEADLDDERFDAPEAPGLDVVCRGLSMICDDETLLAQTGPLFDGLYEYYRRAPCWAASPRDRSPDRTRVDLEPARGIEPRTFLRDRPQDARLSRAGCPASADGCTVAEELQRGVFTERPDDDTRLRRDAQW